MSPKIPLVVPKLEARRNMGLPQSLIDSAKIPERVAFDPKKHLDFNPPPKIVSMKEIGYEGLGISPNAVSDPFSLFTEEAVQQMRAEIFDERTVAEFHWSSKFAAHQIRGYVPQRGRFVYDAWNHPETLAAVSKIAGIDLVPALDYDIGHVNISVPAESPCANPEKNVSDEQEMTAFGWHKDCFPFVCVTMLSDCTGMVGGETALKTGYGDIIKVRGPAMGTAVVMQGKYIEHQALKARGNRERISMVTSFRPKWPCVKDETTLCGVRGISDLNTLLSQYTEYRLENIEERVRKMLHQWRQARKAGHNPDIEGVRDWLLEQMKYIEATATELNGGQAS